MTVVDCYHGLMGLTGCVTCVGVMLELALMNLNFNNVHCFCGLFVIMYSVTYFVCTLVYNYGFFLLSWVA